MIVQPRDVDRELLMVSPQPSIAAIALLLIYTAPGVHGIGCFVCYSKDGSDPRCDDQFDTSTTVPVANHTTRYYQQPCWGYRKGRNGFFPADHCIKIAGKKSDTEGSITIRTCALDSGSLNADTEIVRISHCGTFNYDQEKYTGCVQSCRKDGCNHATIRTSTDTLLFTAGVLLLVNPLRTFLSS